MTEQGKYIKSPKETGKYGEKVVLYYLKTRGYRVLATNLRLKTGEIDILMAKNNAIFLVEVKSTRIVLKNDLNQGSKRSLVFEKGSLRGCSVDHEEHLVEPEDSFTRKKLIKLRLLASDLMSQDWTEGYDIRILGFVVRVLVDKEGLVKTSLVRRLF